MAVPAHIWSSESSSMMSVPGVPVICADAIVVTTDPWHRCVPEPEHTPQKSLSYRALVAPETTRRSDISVGRATDGNVLRGVPGMLQLAPNVGPDLVVTLRSMSA